MSGLKEKPIDHIKGQIDYDDTLEVIDYAKALVAFIEDCSPPITIGVQGDWGSGKTSLLNMIRGSADGDEGGLLGAKRKDGGYLVVNFDAWAYAQFGQEENLPLACMYSLTKKIEEICNDELGQSKAEYLKNKATKLLSSVNKFKAAGLEVDFGEGSEFDEMAQNMIKFKKEFKGYVDLLVSGQNKKYKRIVFFIDDLDRVNPRYAVELLESLKNFMDVDNCIFVIAIDYEVVQTGVALKFGDAVQKRSGRSFFDKIIQLPFVMPASAYNLNRYILTLISEAGLPWMSVERGTSDDATYLQKIKERVVESWAIRLKDLTVCSVGANPRQIKRVINIVKLINIIRSKNSTREHKADQLESQILYGLICMQVAWPEVFAIFAKNPTVTAFSRLEDWDYLDTILPDIYSASSDAEVEFIKNQLSSFIDIFMSMLDANNDESISAKEFEKVQQAMQKARLTSVAKFESPKDDFFNRIKNILSQEAGRFSDDLKIYLDVLFKSKWMTLHSLKYIANSSSRYITIALGRRQIGSLVTLKSRPILLRMNGRMDRVVKILGDQYPGLVLKEQAAESSLTGYGEIIVDFMAIARNPEKITPDNLLSALNTLYENLVEV